MLSDRRPDLHIQTSFGARLPPSPPLSTHSASVTLISETPQIFLDPYTGETRPSNTPAAWWRCKLEHLQAWYGSMQRLSTETRTTLWQSAIRRAVTDTRASDDQTIDFITSLAIAAARKDNPTVGLLLALEFSWRELSEVAHSSYAREAVLELGSWAADPSRRPTPTLKEYWTEFFSHVGMQSGWIICLQSIFPDEYPLGFKFGCDGLCISGVGDCEIGDREVGDREVGDREVSGREAGDREVGDRGGWYDESPSYDPVVNWALGLEELVLDDQDDTRYPPNVVSEYDPDDVCYASQMWGRSRRHSI